MNISVVVHFFFWYKDFQTSLIYIFPLSQIMDQRQEKIKIKLV